MDEEMTLEDYVKETHPSIAEEYKRYTRRHQLPEIGDKVKTLCAGFGSLASRVLTISEIDDKYITLTDGKNNYCSEIAIWYKQIKVKDD